MRASGKGIPMETTGLNSFIKPTKAKLAVFLVLFLFAFPTTTFQVKFPCIEFRGCPTTEPAMLPMGLSLLYSLILGQGVSAVVEYDPLLLAGSLLLSSIIACALGYSYEKYGKCG